MYQLLIVDDEKKILEGISEIFPWNNIGFEVVGKFTKAKAALAFLENHPVDVVMTDISMPDMNGLELAKALKKYPDLIIVIFSSYSDYQYMREAITLEIQDYLLKPINYDKLSSCFEKIKTLLDEKFSINRNTDGSYYGKILKKVDDYLSNHFRDGSLIEAAELVGLSPNYLSKIYKENKGVSFSESLTKIRMQQAGEMLNDPTHKSYEIAYYVGYDSPKNFTRAFKSYYKVTPRDYRNGIRKDEDETC
ncbi:MAG: response regulator [Lachnospiraceae bacterium]|nr:response regulator [Lachnospiraceae bacterium]